METDKHTPGPLIADGGYVRTVTGLPMVHMPSRDRTPQENRANAVLFAAAPLMLDALRAAERPWELMREFGSMNDAEFRTMKAAAVDLRRAAIAAATGEHA